MQLSVVWDPNVKYGMKKASEKCKKINQGETAVTKLTV